MKRGTSMKLIPALVLGVCSGYASAGGFQLLEQNASGQGTAYAGTAVSADDASTVFTNPAGMAMLPQGKKSFSVNLSAIQPQAKFSSSGSVAATLQTLGSGNGGDAGGLAFVPSVYVVMPINNQISLGLGMNAPFGLKTEYDSGWAGRFQGVKSDVKTMNLNPSISFKASDTVSLGFGLNYQQLKGEFTSAVNYAGSVFQAAATPAAAGGLGMTLAQAGGLAGAAGEGTGKITGDDTTWGYNFGAIFQVSPATRLGVTYRSAMKYHLTGTADFSRLAATSVPNATVNAILGSAASAARGGAIYADIKLPDTLTFSAQTKLNDKWDLVGDLAWTGWSKIPDLTFKYQDNSSTVSSTPENWRDTWRLSLGAIHRYNDTWKARFGIAYDQTPVGDDLRRTVRLPDSNRVWVSLGGQYRMNKDSAIDFGYSHLFIKDGSMNNNAGSTAGYGLLLGTYKNSVDILGVQYSTAF